MSNEVMDTSEWNGDIAVRCTSVTKTYGAGNTSVLALRGVDLEVRRGEMLMLVGPSGSGKTTLLSLITAILDRDSGQCEVLHRDLQKMNEKARALFRGRSVGFVFQSFNLLPALTAIENVTVPLLLTGKSENHAAIRAREALDRVGMSARANSLPAQLSGGQQQRVAIARAIVHDPELVVCDEPTSNLDHETGRKMIEILRDAARNPNRAVIVVTHDTRVLEFADRVAHMDDGRIVQIGDANKAQSL